MRFIFLIYNYKNIIQIEFYIREYEISSNKKIKKAKLKVDFENIKSDFLWKKIFNILKKNKFLDIIKYNKKLQKRFNLCINDYKDYCQLYSPI